MTIGILGGGLSGLALGNELSRMNVDFRILEREEECGGLMRSLKEEGFTFDCSGSHVIFSRNLNILEYMLSLLGDNVDVRRRNTKILYGDRLVKYPFENGLADLRFKDRLDCVLGFVARNVRRRGLANEPPVNLMDWCYWKYGRAISEKYLIPYNQKIWKYPLREISTDWVSRIPDPPVIDVVKSGLGIATEGYRHQISFHYPIEGGIQALTDALASRIRSRVHTSFEITKIRRAGDSWIVSNNQRDFEFNELVSTIPLSEMLQMLKKGGMSFDNDSDIRPNSLISIMIGLKAAKTRGLSWMYIPGDDTLSHRVSFPSNFSCNVAPEGKSSMLAEITCRPGDEISAMKDNEIAEGEIKGLHRLSILDEKDVCFTRVVRTRDAYVIHNLQSAQRLERTNASLKKLGIRQLGRLSESQYLNMDDCIAHAFEEGRRAGL